MNFLNYFIIEGIRQVHAPKHRIMRKLTSFTTSQTCNHVMSFALHQFVLLSLSISLNDY